MNERQGKQIIRSGKPVALPDRLYKYYENGVSLESLLKDCSIFLSSPVRFNDPFDCCLNFDTEMSDEQWADWFRETGKKLRMQSALPETDKYIDNKIWKDGSVIEGILIGIRSAFQSHGICCFSEVNDDILMWSHYADKHQGVCVEFRPRYHEDPFARIVQVTYPQKYPSIKLCEEDRIEEMFAAKSKHWEYEKEWRVILAESADSSQKIYPDEISGIIFGCQIRPDDEVKVIRWIHDSFVKPNLYRSIKQSDDFSLKIQSI